MNRGAYGFPPLCKGWLGVFKTAQLPAAPEGSFAYATDCRVFNGAGTQESAGVGTGGLVSINASGVWKIVGTNVTAIA